MTWAVAALLGVMALSSVGCARYPGETGKVPRTFDRDELALAARLREHVTKHFSTQRNVARAPAQLEAAARQIAASFKGLPVVVKAEPFWVPPEGQQADPARVRSNRRIDNIEVTLAPNAPDARPEEIIIIGAHYDSAIGTPGANDNGSGVAAAIELIHSLAARSRKRTVRAVFFANEEEPYFTENQPFNEWMGSRQYVEHIRRRGDRVIAMFSLETLGYYTDRAGSQCFLNADANWSTDGAPRHRRSADTSKKQPPSVACRIPALGAYGRGNFVAIVGNLSSASLVKKTIGYFAEGRARMPAAGITLPVIPLVTDGIAYSDHRSFWAMGVPAVMVTDTAMQRYPYYHWPEDTPENVRFDALATVVRGLADVLERLANE